MTPEQLTPESLTTEMLRLSRLLGTAQETLIKHSHASAEAERDYRRDKSKAYLSSTGDTVAERQAFVESTTNEQMHKAHLEDSLRQAALEAVRSLRAQLSALQSVSTALREEMRMARYGPEVSP